MGLKKLAKATTGLLSQRSSRVGTPRRRVGGASTELISAEPSSADRTDEEGPRARWLQADRRASADDLMTASDAGRILGVSVDMVRVLARNGELPYQSTIGGVRLFKRGDVDALGRRRERSKSGARLKRTR